MVVEILDEFQDVASGRDVAGEPVAFSVVRDVEGRLADGIPLVLATAIVADFLLEFQQEGWAGCRTSAIGWRWTGCRANSPVPCPHF
jgi:hypothetical protein